MASLMAAAAALSIVAANAVCAAPPPAKPTIVLVHGAFAGSSSWNSVVGNLNIPPALHGFMARRAGSREAVAVPGASHVVMISHPHLVSALIQRAAAASTPTNSVAAR